jgi:hypothetical protein
MFMSQWLLEASQRAYGEQVFDAVGKNCRFDFVNNPVDLPASESKTVSLELVL